MSCKLSCVEALAASLYIIGMEKAANDLLEKFKWGPNFLKLNFDALNLYKTCKNSDEIIKYQNEYIEKLDADAVYQRNQPIDLPPEINSSEDEEVEEEEEEEDKNEQEINENEKSENNEIILKNETNFILTGKILKFI